MLDPATPPSTRVRAADSVLDHSAKAIELEDIEMRLAAPQPALGNRWQQHLLGHHLLEGGPGRSGCQTHTSLATLYWTPLHNLTVGWDRN